MPPDSPTHPGPTLHDLRLAKRAAILNPLFARAGRSRRGGGAAFDKAHKTKPVSFPYRRLHGSSRALAEDRETAPDRGLDRRRQMRVTIVSAMRAPRLPAGHGRPPPLGALDAVARHQTLDPAAADGLVGTQQRLPDPSRAVRLGVGLCAARGSGRQPLVLDRAGAALAPRPLEVDPERTRSLSMNALTSIGSDRARWRKTRSPSSRSRSRAAAHAPHTPAHAAAAAAAAPSWSADRRADRRPASAWRTRLRSDSGPIPSSAATCATGRPDSNTSRAPRSNNSSGYFR